MDIAVLNSQIYWQFLTVVLGVLSAGGATIAIAQRVLHKELGGVNRTFRSWLLMAPWPFVAILFGRDAVIGLGLILSCLMFREYAAATGLCRDKPMQWLVILAMLLQAGITFVTDPRILSPGWYGMFMTFPVYAICAISILPILRNRSEGQLKSVSLAVFGYLYFGWMFGHLTFLANSRNAVGYLLYLFFAVSVADVAAFTCGNLFGKRKLRDGISPNKTVAGAIGAFTVSMALPWLLAFALPDFSIVEKLLTGLIIGIGGHLGDLTISYIKRDVGIKDMGTLIPGHGGLLDRMDSLIFTAPLFFHMIRWFHGI